MLENLGYRAEDEQAPLLMNAVPDSELAPIDPHDESLLSAEQEVKLAFQIQAGRRAADQLNQASTSGTVLDEPSKKRLESAQRQGQRARSRLIMANLGLVREQAQIYHLAAGVEFEDLVQAGIGAVDGPEGPLQTGLIRAVEKFDPTKGFKFSTYASDWIRKAMQAAVQNYRSPVRIGNDDTLAVNKLYKTIVDLSRTSKGLLDNETLAAAMDVSVDEIRRLQVLYHHYWKRGAVMSLDVPIGEDVHTTFVDVLKDVGAEEQQRLRATFDKHLGRLTMRQRLVVLMYCGFDDPNGQPASLSEIAERVGYNVPAARTDLKKALALLAAK